MRTSFLRMRGMPLGESPERAPSPFLPWEEEQLEICHPKRALTQLKLAGTLTSDFQSPETEK